MRSGSRASAQHALTGCVFGLSAARAEDPAAALRVRLCGDMLGLGVKLVHRLRLLFGFHVGKRCLFLLQIFHDGFLLDFAKAVRMCSAMQGRKSTCRQVVSAAESPRNSLRYDLLQHTKLFERFGVRQQSV